MWKQPYRAKCTEDMLSKASRIVAVLRELRYQGLAVVDFACGDGQPVIEVMPCRKLDQMLSDGQATVGNISDYGGGAVHRRCWTTIGGCRIVWSVNGQPFHPQKRIIYGSH